MAESIYESLGVRTVIDAWGTVTALGGSLMAPEVLQAMQSAAGAFVDMSELHTAAGRRIADLLGVEACCVTCGAAAGLAIAAAACMTGTRRSYAYQLPDTTGMKDEILCLKCHRDLYDQGMLLSGAHFVEIGVTSSAFLQQIEDRITERTAAFFYISSNGSAVVRKPGDYISKMIELAGGKYVFTAGDLNVDENALSSANIQFEAFYALAKDADCLIYNGTVDGGVDTLAQLTAKNPLLADFRAVQTGNVWCTNAAVFQQTSAAAEMTGELHRIFAGGEGDYTFFRRLS